MTLLERVRRALESDFDVRGEIGRGGMGIVYDALDRTLDHRVAIKVLRPELATARAVERFLREGRALAAVDHPGVVRVHRAGEAGGLHYYVMEYLEGETLAERLTRGPLPRAAFDRLWSDLLSALAAVHDAGIVHRDVNPSNIFIVGDRAVLGDFGIAAPSGDRPAGRLTATGELVGTRSYLAPEQRAGESSKATDVYAAALVLYEARTGTPWRDAGPNPWAGMGRGIRWALRRALDPDPGGRPPDGRAFLDERARHRLRRRWLRAGGAAALSLVIVAIVLVYRGAEEPEPATADLAILPFRSIAADADDEQVARDLWQLTTLNLENLHGLRVMPLAQASRLATRQGRPLDDGAPSPGTGWVARGSLLRVGESLVVRLAVQDSAGRPLAEARVPVSAGRPYETADSVALALVRLLVPHLASSYRRLEALHTDNFRALRAFFQGEDAFIRNEWGLAEQHYGDALREDPGFTLARWRLWFVHGWRMSGEYDYVDLERLAAEHAHELGTVDSALLRARAVPPGVARIDSLERVAQRHGHSAYPWFLLGEEHYHRGPLVGRTLEEAVHYLTEAATRDPEFAPAYEHSVFALLRLGREAEAFEALDRLSRTAAPPAPGPGLHTPTFLAQAVRERFRPEEAAEGRALLDPSDAERLADLMFIARIGLEFDLPGAQLELGRGLAAREGPSARAQGHTAAALALHVLGMPAAALPHLDSAAALRTRVTALDSTGTGRLEAAEWRVLGPALGIVGIPPEEVAAGRRWLRRAADGRGEVAERATWALALDARESGDTAGARRWSQRLAGLGEGEEGDRLRALEVALAALHDGRYDAVLRLTRPLLARQFAPDPGYPFTRAALHLVRARAFEAMEDWQGARRERRWADNRDTTGELIGPLQAVEVDWATSPYSDRYRARAALALADTAVACRLLQRVERLWTDAEPALDSIRGRDANLRRRVCP